MKKESLRLLSQGEIHLWYIHLELLNGPQIDSLRSVLSSEERRNAESFRLPLLERQRIAARALLRLTLSQYAAVGPADWRIVSGRGGKPQLAEGQTDLNLKFSLSHTTDMVICAICLGADIGADVEKVTNPADVLKGARRAMTETEWSCYSGLPPEMHRRYFFRTWTAKEAVSKSLGIGLALPFDALQCYGTSQCRLMRDIYSSETPDNIWHIIRPFLTWDYEVAIAVPLYGHGGTPCPRLTLIDKQYCE